MFLIVFEPFDPRLTSKFAKRSNMIPKIFFLSKMIYGYKKTQDFIFDVYFETVEKVEKNSL
jgi:hypothetical protein